MNRLHLFELEDQPWLPASVRNGATDLLDVMFAKMAFYRPLAPILRSFIDATGHTSLLDLGSGGGGGVLAMRAELAALGRDDIEMVLSDRYPNGAARARIAGLGAANLSYRAEPVNALAVAPGRHGVRTMFGALHHFQPDQVRRLLQAAVDAHAPIACFDVAASPALRRVPVALAPLAAVPNLAALFVIALLLVPMARPFRWSRLFFSYLIPLIPIVFAWDGTVSALRAYTPDELRQIAGTVRGGDGYKWESGQAGRALFLTGRPDAFTPSSTASS